MSKGIECVERLARELAERTGSVELGEQGFDRVLAAWRDWRGVGGDMEGFVASLERVPRDVGGEPHQVTAGGVAEFAAVRDAAIAGFERVRQIEAGDALRPGASLSEIAQFEALQDVRWQREIGELYWQGRRALRGLSEPGAEQRAGSSGRGRGDADGLTVARCLPSITGAAAHCPVSPR